MYSLNVWNVFKSALVCVLLVFIVYLLVRQIMKLAQKYRNRECFHREAIIVAIICPITLTLVISLYDYVYPFERKLEPEMVASINVSSDYFTDGIYGEYWHSVYEAYGFREGSWLHPHEFYMPKSIDEWPEMDLENYTYIITYCQKIDSLTYNVWDTIDAPIHSAEKEGHMVFDHEISPYTIYVYRIPKMRINNPI